MAESRWPDVVPARKEAGGEHLQQQQHLQSSSDPLHPSSSGSGGSSSSCPTAWHISILAQNNVTDPPVVQIWTHNLSPTDSPPPPPPLDDDDESNDRQQQQHTTRRSSNHSGYSSYSGDSGIDSQLSSPTVTDSGRLHSHQAFVLDLSATHLAVPSKLKPSLCASSNSSAIYDYGASLESSPAETVVTVEAQKVDEVDRNHPSESTDVSSSHSSASQNRWAKNKTHRKKRA